MQNEFLTYILELLSPHGPITTKAMFGGYGLYKNGIIFASIINNTLYFKVDDTTRELYEARNAEPFVHELQGKKVYMPYWTVPLDVLENPEELKEWLHKAYEVALKSKLQ